MGCEQAGSGDITLSITADNLPIATRSAHDNSASGAEVSISHLDVLVFTSEDETNTGKENTLYYYERVSPPADGSGKITLGKKRAEFGTDTYYVYLIANYTGETLDENGAVKINDPDKLFVEGTFTVEDLKALTQYDIDIDLTGSDAQGVSKFFLMDGAAYMEGGTEPAETTSASKLKLYNNDPTNNTRLVVNLRRAAAKIIINIKSSENVRFDNDESVLVDGDQDDEDSISAGAVAYYFQHITTQTHVIPPVKIYTENDTKEVSTDGMMRESGWGFAANDEYLVLVSKDDPNAPEKDGEANKYVESIMVQGYAYAHNWNNKDMGHDTRLVVNIPLWHKTTIKTETTDAEGNTVTTNTDSWDFFGNNFYQVPVSKTKKLERNTLYIVNVTVDTKGSMSYNSAVQLTDVTFDTRDWKDVEVNVGSSQGNKPVYLSLNERNIPIFQSGTSNSNTAVNTTAPVDSSMTLQFASSSTVTVEIANWYYENADGDRQYRYSGGTSNGVKHSDEKGNTSGVTAASASQFRYALDSKGNYIINPTTYSSATKKDHTVTLYDPADPKNPKQKVTLADLNGSIKIYSTVPSNYAVRYIILRVTSTDLPDKPQYVVYAHYPSIYVTHEMGWYSYREDFGGTTWQTLLERSDLTYATTASDTGTQTTLTSNPNLNTSTWRCGCTWSRTGGGRWSYGTTEEGFFGSKVYRNNTIYYSRWSSPSSGKYRRRVPTDDRNGEEEPISNTLINPRMYHIQVSASTNNYTIGVPKQTSGVTDSNQENQLLVSPSFMIASQLGATMGLDSDKTRRLKEGADHCKQYVETYKDDKGNVVHLNDWRLPTEAEIQFIVDAQYTPNSPMARVLAGSNYLAASGEWGVNSSGNGNSALRCVRDAFTTPAARPMPVVGYSIYDPDYEEE